jgi:RNA polymerase sigma-70 factor (ECF subfamily)
MFMNTIAIDDPLTERYQESDQAPWLGTISHKGHCEAFTEIYEKFQPRIYRYILFRVTDETTAEDLTSQVFMKAWEGIDHYQPAADQISPWLFTIAHNTIIDYYRTYKETIQLEMSGSLAGEGLTPEEESESLYEMKWLHEAIANLTAEQQHVVIMKYLKGWSTEEIASQMGKRTGTVRALQMRALQSLSKQMTAGNP